MEMITKIGKGNGSIECKKTTSGKFKIIYINSPEEMKQAQTLIDIDPENDYFK